MNYIKKAKTAIKDVQEIQKGLKEMGFIKEKPKEHPTEVAPVVADPVVAAPSVAAHSTTATNATASSIAAPSVFTPGTTPAPSERADSFQVNDLSVPPSQRDGAPAKMPLVARKKIRDDFEAAKSELEHEFSRVLGTPWKIHVDTAGVYSYMANETGALTNPGMFIVDYFKGALDHITSFTEQHGVDAVNQINSAAPQHLITLEPTPDPSVQYVTVDFHVGRLRLLFRDTAFGYNSADTGANISAVVNNHSKTAGASSSGPLSLNAQTAIRNDYEPQIGQVLAKAQKLLAAPSLTFHPNFEQNFATLSAFAAANPADLRSDWESALGSAALNYFEGFVFQLESQRFGDDEMMQEGFKDIVDKLVISFVVSETLSETRNHNDCVIEDGVLLVRTKPSGWWVNYIDACDGLIDKL